MAGEFLARHQIQDEPATWQPPIQPAAPAAAGRDTPSPASSSGTPTTDRGLSFTEIGQLTGYSRTAISDLARAYEIPASIYREGMPLKAPAVPGHQMSNSKASN